MCIFSFLSQPTSMAHTSSGGPLNSNHVLLDLHIYVGVDLDVDVVFSILIVVVVALYCCC